MSAHVQWGTGGFQREQLPAQIVSLAREKEGLDWTVEAFERLLDMARRGPALVDADMEFFTQFTNMVPPPWQPVLTHDRLVQTVERVEPWSRWPEHVEGEEQWIDLLDAYLAQGPDVEKGMSLAGKGRFSWTQGNTPDKPRVGLAVAQRWLDPSSGKIDLDPYMTTLFPARSPGTFAVRRARISDLIIWMNQEDPNRLRERLPRLWGWDYAFVKNILVMDIIYDGWWDWWDALGAFDQGYAHWTLISGWVNNLLKSRPTDIDTQVYAESKALAGYQFVAGLKDHDPGQQIKDYALGGNARGLNPATAEREFRHFAESLLASNVALEPMLSFHDFIADARNWAYTTGSSSVGRVEWSFTTEDGKVVKGDFKARKNLAQYVLNRAELADEALAAVQQQNWVLTKEEKAKVRLAVAGDLLTYLKMSWLLQFTNHGYLSWRGNTIEETNNTARLRAVAMMKAAEKWVMPFDYKGFETQPNTWEIQIICQIIFQSGAPNVPDDLKPEWDQVLQNVLDSFDDSVLIATEEMLASVGIESRDAWILVVIGGLMSGLRITSVLGNGWNTTLFLWALAIMEALGLDISSYEGWYRGDDSYIAMDSWSLLMVLRIILAALGAEGGVGKFGIFKPSEPGQFGEFLRVRYTPTQLSGYVARTVPGIWSRTPWSNSPPSPEDALVGTMTTLRTLHRRSGKLGFIRLGEVIASRTAERKGYDIRWLKLDKKLGGAGILPWEGDFPASGRFPVFEAPELDVQPNQDSINATLDHFRKWDLTQSEAVEVTTSRMRATIVMDDVRSINALIRKGLSKPPITNWKRYTPALAKRDMMRLAPKTALLASLAPGVEKTILTSEAPTRWWGSMRAYAAEWNDWREVARVREWPLSQWLDSHFEWKRADLYLAKRGFPRSFRIDWLLGDFTYGDATSVHPEMLWLLNLYTASAIDVMLINRKLFSKIELVGTFHFIWTYMLEALEQSTYYTALGGW